MSTAISHDAIVREAVTRELCWDPRVEDAELSADVERGVVTLRGTVSSYARRQAAEEAAHRVAGVRDVEIGRAHV